MRTFFLLSSLVAAIQVGSAFQWTSSNGIPDGSTIPTCSGVDVTLPWTYTSEQAEHITNIEWYYQAPGGDPEILATQVMGNFFAAPSAQMHMEFVPNAGIVIKNATLADVGSYWVQVNINLHGTMVEEKQVAQLQISEDPWVADGQLRVTMLPDAVYDANTSDFHVRLACGNFQPPWDPYVSVVWTTPSNQTLPSTFHENGQFILTVPNPAESGQYTCAIEDTPAMRSCLAVDSPLRTGSSVAVDGVTVQLAILGVKLAVQQTQLQVQQAKDAEMETRLHALQVTEESLVQENAHLKQIAEAASAEAAHLRTQLQSAAKQVFFHATPSSNKDLSDPLFIILSPPVFDHVESNIGGGYNGRTGVFTVPVSGVYLFIVTVDRQDENAGAIHATLHVDGSSGAEVYGAFETSGTNQIAAHLNAGQTARVVVGDAGNGTLAAGPMSSFTGVLVQPDI